MMRKILLCITVIVMTLALSGDVFAQTDDLTQQYQELNALGEQITEKKAEADSLLQYIISLGISIDARKEQRESITSPEELSDISAIIEKDILLLKKENDALNRLQTEILLLERQFQAQELHIRSLEDQSYVGNNEYQFPNQSPPSINRSAAGSNLSSLLNSIQSLLNVIAPVIFALALLYFLWGVANFVLKPDNPDVGKQKMFWGLIGLFVMSTLWGIVFFIADQFNIEVDQPIITDQETGIFDQVENQDVFEDAV